MNYDERENFPFNEVDFQNDELKFSRQESHYSSLYDSITVCSDHEIGRYFRGQCNATAWDDEDLDDNLEEENAYYEEDDSLESMDRPL
ncbi:hypothetical protein ASE21_13295 [Flavobacterium sp. Root901]|uniref:hypothetical protein n=1 Tax=Flavobacterium sp. Root901 TaxID=1736605 RepID=UPI00070F524E|nr:hypothetical protein [Flavobacterium sp. Root901]KRD08824.1 hypothetical protein ASE21_13295 [Flavobacterium sp. Root901]